MIESQLITGDCIEELKKMHSETVQLIMTSPPYYSLRRYTNDSREVGIELSWREYVVKLVEVFRECKRVLTPAGSFFLNIGDCYVGTGSKRGDQRNVVSDCWHPEYGDSPTDLYMQPGCLLGMPWRVAFALVDDGWTLRNAIPQIKLQALMESVKNRFSTKHEMVFFFVKDAVNYYFNLEAVKEPPMNQMNFKVAEREMKRRRNKYEYKYMQKDFQKTETAHKYEGVLDFSEKYNSGEHKGVNPGDWWLFIPARTKLPHYAAYSEEICKRPILASTRPNDIVLDPFGGTGTTAVVAKKFGRRYISIDLSAENTEMSKKRLEETTGMLPLDVE